jgi:hypothetical protein
MKTLKSSSTAKEIPVAANYADFATKYMERFNELRYSIMASGQLAVIQICYRFTKVKTVKGSFAILRTGLYRDYIQWARQLVSEYPELFSSSVEVVSYSGKHKRFDDDLIYFVTDGTQKYIKIGYTNNLKSRLSGLETSNPHGIILLGVMNGGREEEKQLHRYFKPHHHMKEWFIYNNEIKDFINSDFVYKNIHK